MEYINFRTIQFDTLNSTDLQIIRKLTNFQFDFLVIYLIKAKIWPTILTKINFFWVKKSKLCHLISSLTTVRAMKTIKRYFHKLLWLTAKKLVYDWEQAENVAENLFLISQFFNDL